MTTSMPPDHAAALLDDVERQRRRTRRLLDPTWFSLGTVGAALALAAVVAALAGDGWGLAVMVPGLGAAYTAIAVHTRRADHRLDLGAGRTSWLSIGLSATIAAGVLVLSNVVHGDGGLLAGCAWAAAGCAVYAVWLRSRLCAGLAVLVVAVGATTVATGADVSLLAYGVTFLVVAGGAWQAAGRRR